MKIISGKSIFASLVFLIVISFIVNNFINNDIFFKIQNVKYSTTRQIKSQIRVFICRQL